MAVIFLPAAVYGQEPVFPGVDAYFEFALRDTPNIVMRGSVGQAVAQKPQDPQEADAPPRGGAGLLGVIPSPVGDGRYRIASLEIECVQTFCKNPDNMDALIRATGLELGHLTDARELQIATERLRKTGFFSGIHPSYETEGDRIRVTFHTVAHTFIRKIVIDDSGALYESEIKKRMLLRPGAPLYPRTALLRGKDPDAMDRAALIQIALDDQRDSLRRLYEKAGYFDAEVSLETVDVGEERVDIHINVRNAHAYSLGKIYARGHEVRRYSDIESSLRSGFSFFGNMTKEALEDAVQNVIEEYRKLGYYQAKIDYISRRNAQTHTVDVFLDIHEGEKWSVQFKGNEALERKELLKSLTFMSSGYVDNGELAASVQALEGTYVSAGYYYASVRGEILRNGAGDSNLILFTINEGERVEIGEIEFEGASVLTRDELLNVISSREYTAFGSGAYPQRAMIADDAAKIVDAYREHGYLSADVKSWSLESIDSTPRMRLTFYINEGEASHFSSRQIRYTDREMYDKFDVLIDKPANDIFSDYAFRAERAAITKQLRQRGHATVSDKARCTSYTSDGAVASEETCEIASFASACMPDNIDAMCRIMDTPTGKVEHCKRHYDTEYDIEGEPACRLKDGITGTEVDVEYEVTLGPKYAFGDTFVHGNVVTRDWVIRQDIPFKAGEIYDVNRMIDARSLLRRRAIYKSATLNAIGVDDGLSFFGQEDSTGSGEQSVPLVVSLEEGERRWFDFALGVSRSGGDWILTGEAEFVEANLLGTGWDLRFLIMPEARFFTNSSEFVFTQKFNQNFFALLTLTIPVIPSSGFNVVTQLFYDLRYIPSTNKEEYGWLVELQWNVSKALFTALAFELESSNTSSFGVEVSDDIGSYHACYPFTFFMDCPFSSANEAFTISLTPRISYDRRDSPVVPKNGFYTEAKIKLAYANSIGFYAIPEARASFAHTFLKYFTMAFNLRFGMSIQKRGESIPLIDRFFLGGLNMRGYDNEALGPRLVNDLTPSVPTNEAGGGEALFNFTAELRYPIWNGIGLYGAIFTDIGALTQRQPAHYGAGEFARELFVREMRYSAGLGLRWHISESIPPIVIDYGFIINRRRGDPIGNFTLNIGYSF